MAIIHAAKLLQKIKITNIFEKKFQNDVNLLFLTGKLLMAFTPPFKYSLRQAQSEQQVISSTQTRYGIIVK